MAYGDYGPRALHKRDRFVTPRFRHIHSPRPRWHYRHRLARLRLAKIRPDARPDLCDLPDLPTLRKCDNLDLRLLWPR